MKIGKYIPFIMLIFAITIIACTSENDVINNEAINKNISLNTYEQFKGQLVDINKFNKSRVNSRLEQNNHILSQVNNIYGTDIDFDDSLKELDSPEEIFSWLKSNSDFNQNDIDILTNFSSNLTTQSFDAAVSILENEISDETVNSFKFEKYQSIVNGVALIEYQYPGFFTVETVTYQKSESWGCAWAVAKLALASASLVAACNPPALGATVGTGCYLASTGFVAASASVGMACSKE